eukprot:GHVL01001367.1.p1 GENE.GHVL01001367.1~~GHVL01001367.1.p1  ORF type:complete len:211 (+),score=1.21 GHVL01001367.1:1032-1664(+)
MCFRKDVLKHYKKCCSLSEVINVNDFVSECIQYNLNIIRDHGTIVNKEWIENDVVFVHQLLHLNGHFFTFEEFRLNFPFVQTNFVFYEGVIKSLRKYQRKVQIDSLNGFQIRDYKPWQIICRGKQAIKEVFLKSKFDANPAGMNRWSMYFYNLNWKQIFDKCFKTTKDTQLRWFQTRLLHRILGVASRLFVQKILDSPLCAFCKIENETI